MLISSLKLEISGVDVQGSHQNTIKTAKMVAFSAECFSENDFFSHCLEAVLATFFCYNCGSNISEAVKKITTDQKDCHKCSSLVTVCCIAKAYRQ